MPNYKYKGRDKKGQEVEGLIEASSQTNAVTKLTSADVIPISIVMTTNETTVEDLIGEYLGLGHPKTDDLIMCIQQLYTLSKAGVPLIRALRVVSETTTHRGLRGALTDMVISLESGFRLSKAMGKHPHIFSPLIIAMIEVGEDSGQLENSFLQIKAYLESELETRRRIKTALRYPFMVLVAIIVAVCIINLVVIPSFSNFFNAFGSQLPLPTRILIACSDAFVNYGWALAFFLLMIMISIGLFLKSEQGMWWWSYLKLRLPLVGSIIKRTIYARFCRAFAMTVSANVPLLKGFSIVSKVADNAYVAQKIVTMRQHVEKGETLYLAAKNSDLFSPLVLQMLAVGEETGEIDSILLDIAYYYEKDVDYDLKKLGDAIEPLLIIIIALMVLVLALGVFLPMWDISTVALRKMETL